MNRIHPRLLVKILLFLVVAPGTVVGWLPALILRGSAPPPFSLLSLAALLIGLAGAFVVLRCVRDFAVHGTGTPAPIDPPKTLVVHGLYRHTRNPMYLGILAILAGEVLFFLSGALLLYAGFVFLFFNLFIVMHEEKDLRRRFGGEYERYRGEVPRWRISSRPYDGGPPGGG